MLPDVIVAVFLASCLTIFFGVNLYNLAKSNRAKRNATFKAEVEMPHGPVFVLAALGTFVFFGESILYVILVLSGFQYLLTSPLLQLYFPFDFLVQTAGMFVTALGYFLFVWSVLARGKYATSWNMSEDHKLVTWGPYRYIRHPSYTAYFILFAGLFLTLVNLIAVIPFIAILGYVQITQIEEELLTRRFGEEYAKYQCVTGKFFPKRSQRHEKIDDQQ